MYGAIIGDLAGSIYEYNQTKKITPVKMNKIIENNAFFSDDTILTIAILDAIKHNQDYNKYLRLYIEKYQDYKPDFEPYFKSPFSPGLLKWSKNNTIGTSRGNGAMMRISPVAYMYNKEKDVINNANLATIPSHNSKEALDSASTIALMIYYFRKGFSKDEVFNKLGIVSKYRPFSKFNTTCQETINNCLYAVYKANSFEEAISNTLLMGGDTDTNCCIVGSISEALFGIDKLLIKKANEHLPKEFVMLLTKK